MGNAPTNPSNAELVAYWNGATAERWVRYQGALDRALAPFGRAAMDAAAVRPGARVLDVGCGAGDTTLALSDRVGPSGSVLGLDLSQPLLARAQERAAGVTNVQFALGDASEHPLPEGHFDLIYSRFGVMFFVTPEEAFAHLRRALKPEGRLAFVCWRALSDNPWAKTPLDAVLPLLGPQEPLPPDVPGPFAFAAEERTRRVLDLAGFTRIGVEPLETDLPLGQNLEVAADFLLHIGPAARSLANATPEVRQGARHALLQALEPHLGASGVRLRGRVWVVRASH